MQIEHHTGPKEGIFKAMENGSEMGWMTYEWVSETVFAITHTVVDEAFRGRGVARALVDEAVSYARENDYRIHPVCSYAVAVLGREGFEDVYAPEFPR